MMCSPFTDASCGASWRDDDSSELGDDVGNLVLRKDDGLKDGQG